MKRATRPAPTARLRRRRRGMLALALAVALPAPALSFLVGLAFATLHGPHRVLVGAAPSCTDIVLHHDAPGGAEAAAHDHALDAPGAATLGSPCAMTDAHGTAHMICVSQVQDPRASVPRSIDLPEAGAHVLPVAYPTATAGHGRFASCPDAPRSALSPAARRVVLRL